MPKIGDKVWVISSGREGTVRWQQLDGWFDVVFPDMGLQRPHGSFHQDNLEVMTDGHKDA